MSDPGSCASYRTSRRRLLASAGGLALAGALPGALRAAAAQPSATVPPAAARERLDMARLEDVLARAARLPRLHALLIAHRGAERIGEVFGGPGLVQPVNV